MRFSWRHNRFHHMTLPQTRKYKSKLLHLRNFWTETVMPNNRIFRQRNDRFLIHESNQKAKKVFLNSLMRINESKNLTPTKVLFLDSLTLTSDLFLGSLFRNTCWKNSCFESMIQNKCFMILCFEAKLQRSYLLILWFGATVQNLCFFDHFPKQKQEKWIKWLFLCQPPATIGQFSVQSETYLRFEGIYCLKAFRLLRYPRWAVILAKS